MVWERDYFEKALQAMEITDQDTKDLQVTGTVNPTQGHKIPQAEDFT